MPSYRHVVLASLLPLMLAGVSWAQPAEELPADTRHLAGGEVCDPILPALAALPEGGFAAAWIDGRVHSGVFGRHAERLGPETVRGTREQRPTDPQVAVSSSGRIAIGWLENDGPHVQILDSKGRPVTGDLALGGPAPGNGPDLLFDDLPQVFDLLADPAGGFIAMWTVFDTHAARIDENGEIQRIDPPAEGGFELSRSGFQVVFHPDGHLWWADHLDTPIDPLPTISLLRVLRTRLDGPDAFKVEELFTDGRPLLRRKAIAVDDQGRVVVAWNEPGGIFAQRLTASGEPVGETLTVVVEDLEATPSEQLYSLDLAVDPAGNFAVVWGRLLFDPSGFFVGSALFVHNVGADGTSLGPTREVVSAPFDRLLSPHVAVSGPGEVTVAWWRETVLPILPPDCSFSETVFARRVTLAGDSTLLLGDGRFRVDVAWEDPFNGGSGVGHAISGTADSGGFWFFDPDNTELKVKVIDGRAVNGRFWFFYGALSNVEYRITVTDQRTGLSKTYDNPPGVFGSSADTFAFPAP